MNKKKTTQISKFNLLCMVINAYLRESTSFFFFELRINIFYCNGKLQKVKYLSFIFVLNFNIFHFRERNLNFIFEIHIKVYLCEILLNLS